MSHDLYFRCEPLPERHNVTGGTYALGGTREPWLNITYNYGRIYRAKCWPEGLRALDGKTAVEVAIECLRAAEKLGRDEHPDYWRATEGNARRALLNLRALALKCPHDAKLEIC